MVFGPQPRRQDLFLVRFWSKEAGEGAIEWRGKVQRTVSGETHYFHDWSELVELLSKLLMANDSDGLAHGPAERGIGGSD